MRCSTNFNALSNVANAFENNNSALESLANGLKNVATKFQCIFQSVFNAFSTYLLCRVFANRVTYDDLHVTIKFATDVHNHVENYMATSASASIKDMNDSLTITNKENRSVGIAVMYSGRYRGGDRGACPLILGKKKRNDRREKSQRGK